MIDENEFWRIIDEARAKTSKLTDIPNWLIQYLKERSVEDIIDFEKQKRDLLIRSYDARLWEAAALFRGGCGDDTFDDFRKWLIAQGKMVYEQALENPDSLAEVDSTTGEWGEPVLFKLGSVAIDAFRQKTGADDSAELPIDYAKYHSPFRLLNREYLGLDSFPDKLALAFPKLFALDEARRKANQTPPVFPPYIEPK